MSSRRFSASSSSISLASPASALLKKLSRLMRPLARDAGLVPAPTGPELYVRVLVASRDVRVRGIGRRLMAFADEQARAAGVDHLRVDCYAGGSGDLVRFYESCGYTRIAPFNVDGWPGMLLGRTL